MLLVVSKNNTVSDINHYDCGNNNNDNVAFLGFGPRILTSLHFLNFLILGGLAGWLGGWWLAGWLADWLAGTPPPGQTKSIVFIEDCPRRRAAPE